MYMLKTREFMEKVEELYESGIESGSKEIDVYRIG